MEKFKQFLYILGFGHKEKILLDYIEDLKIQLSRSQRNYDVLQEQFIKLNTPKAIVPQVQRKIIRQIGWNTFKSEEEKRLEQEQEQEQV